MTIPSDPTITSTELDPVPTVMEGMPAPSLLRRRLHDAIDQGVDRMRVERGEVRTAEDTYPLQRALAGSIEKCTDYAAAFTAAKDLLVQYQEEEVIAVQGEQAGVPTDGITIPDVNGDIRLTVGRKNTHTIDADQVRSAIIGALVGQGPGSFTELVTDVVNGDHEHHDPGDLEGLLVQLVDQAMTILVACGNYKPQITKVKAYAADLSRGGDDKLAAVVTGTIRTTSEYTGVKTTRKAAKP